jgi:ArsR family transcriptional regulator
MAPSTTTQFSAKQHTAAALFKALAHPARLAILALLSQRQTCFCGDLTQELPLAQSTISQHLKALKNAGLIKGEIDGVKTCYCLDEKGIEQLEELMLPLIQQLNIQNQKTCC